MIIVQARMNSSRLPGKVVREIGGVPVISRVLRACLATNHNHQVIVTLPEEDKNSDLARLVQEEFEASVEISFGPELDVFGRFQKAYFEFKSSLLNEPRINGVVRVCADRPFLQPDAIDLLEHDDSVEELLFNHQPNPGEIGPIGLGAESMSRRLAEKFFEQDSGLKRSKEHVTSELYKESSISVKQVSPAWYSSIGEVNRFDLDVPSQVPLSELRAAALRAANESAFLPGFC